MTLFVTLSVTARHSSSSTRLENAPITRREAVITRRPLLKLASFGRKRFYCSPHKADFSVSATLLEPVPSESSLPGLRTDEQEDDDMERSKLGNTDIVVPRMWLGCWQHGGRSWGDARDEKDYIKSIRSAQERGINAYETSEIYGDGESERVIGKALHKVNRETFVVSTSVWCGNLRGGDVLKACERSLQNLNTDHIDIYNVHWPSGSFSTEVVPIWDTLEALQQLKDRGNIRAVALSNFDLNTLTQVHNDSAILTDDPARPIVYTTPFDVVYAPRSLFWRASETFLLPFCEDRGVPVLDVCPLAQGLATGRFDPSHHFAPWEDDDIRSRNKLFRNQEVLQRAHKAVGVLRRICIDMYLPLPVLALAWALHTPRTTKAAPATQQRTHSPPPQGQAGTRDGEGSKSRILLASGAGSGWSRGGAGRAMRRVVVGSADSAHIYENAGAMNVRLSEEQYNLITKVGQYVTAELDPEDECMWQFPTLKPRALQSKL